MFSIGNITNATWLCEQRLYVFSSGFVFKKKLCSKPTIGINISARTLYNGRNRISFKHSDSAEFGIENYRAL